MSDFEKAMFEISGDTYEIDDWWKKAEQLAIHRGLTMTERDISTVEKIIEAATFLKKYTSIYTGSFYLDDADVFDHIQAEERVEYAEKNYPSYTSYIKRRKKTFGGIEFILVKCIEKEEYESHDVLEGVA